MSSEPAMPTAPMSARSQSVGGGAATGVVAAAWLEETGRSVPRVARAIEVAGRCAQPFAAESRCVGRDGADANERGSVGRTFDFEPVFVARIVDPRQVDLAR